MTNQSWHAARSRGSGRQRVGDAAALYLRSLNRARQTLDTNAVPATRAVTAEGDAGNFHRLAGVVILVFSLKNRKETFGDVK